ncbi:hypothetical protein D3C86_1593940 [compost metagenome]
MPGEHPSPFVRKEGDSENLLAPMIYIGTTTTSGGTWTIDYTEVGFVSAPVVVATLLLNDSDVYDRSAASLSGAPTTTSASGYGVRWANLTLLGSTARTVPDGTVVHVIAIGETFTEQ